MTSETHRVEIDVVDFQISCRRFTVRAMITRDRQLPVVDEFVLRLLAILDRMPVARMRSWFGFSEAEMETVLVDIGRRNFIEFDGNEVVLAPAGRDLFKVAEVDSIPQIVEVAPLIGDVWFDLVSRNMVPRSRSKPADYLVKLPEILSARELPEAFARTAFEENFRDYVRRIRRFPDADAINLYSISGVEGGAYGYQVLQAGLMLDTDHMSVRPIFPDTGDSGASFQKLTVAANNAWQMASPPEAAASTFSEFERMTGETRLTSLMNAPEDVDAWINAFSLTKLPNSDFQPTLGASYLKGNLKRLLETIETFDSPAVHEIVWLRPSGSTWGRTVQVVEALAEMREALRIKGHADVRTSLLMPRSTQKAIRASHKKVFDNGWLLPQGHLPSNMEVLLIPDVAALVNVHVRAGMHSVPVGGLVFDSKRVARIGERLRPGQAGGWEKVWTPTRSPRTTQEPE